MEKWKLKKRFSKYCISYKYRNKSVGSKQNAIWLIILRFEFFCSSQKSTGKVADPDHVDADMYCTILDDAVADLVALR